MPDNVWPPPTPGEIYSDWKAWLESMIPPIEPETPEAPPVDIPEVRAPATPTIEPPTLDAPNDPKPDVPSVAVPSLPSSDTPPMAADDPPRDADLAAPPAFSSELPLARGASPLDGEAPRTASVLGPPLGRPRAAIAAPSAPGAIAVVSTALPTLSTASVPAASEPFGVMPEYALPLAIALVFAAVALVLPHLLLYRRFGAKEALTSDRRRQILDYITARPGANVAEVARAIGVHYNTAAYQLDVLTRLRILVRRGKARATLYFENHGRYTEAEMDAIALSRSEASLAVLRLVASMPGIPQAQLAARLAVSEATMSWRMKRLLAVGVVARSEEGLRLTPEGARVLVSAQTRNGSSVA